MSDLELLAAFALGSSSVALVALFWLLRAEARDRAERDKLIDYGFSLAQQQYSDVYERATVIYERMRESAA